MADGSNSASSVKANAPPQARSQFKLLGIGVGCLLVVVPLSMVVKSEVFFLMLLCAAAAIFIFTTFRTLWLLMQSSMFHGNVPALTWAGIVVSGFIGALLSLITFSELVRGRQLRRFGKVLLPRVGDDEAWSTIDLSPSVDANLRTQLAAQWRENGRSEHASVAAFARLQLDLMALGAPPELLRSASQDALDEIRHAELCFSLARALDGQDLGPQAFPEASNARGKSGPRKLALVQLAVDSLVEGALLEGFSARLIAQLVPVCLDEATRALLRELAADEGRHSKHGWDVVEWCLEQGGESVASALRGALEGLPKSVTTTLPLAARGGSWEQFGIGGQAREDEAYAETRAHVVSRLEALLGASRRAA